jgi:quercetin dioxygenase-like cupin family protein
MLIRPKAPTVKNPPEQFTGDVWFDVIASPQDDSQRMVVGVVRFAPGARTAWHSHANGQTLHVIQGVARMQARGGDIIEVQAGQTVYTPPGRNTGTVPPRMTSWSTSLCTRTATTPTPPRPGDSTSPTRNTTPARTELNQSL